MKSPLAILLSINAGYVDTAGFLALQGLFTAHVTGNFVTLGASLVFGTTGVVAKLIALPVFCLIVALIRGLGHTFGGHRTLPIRIFLCLKLALLLVAATLAILLGPFPNGDAWPALATGMVLISAMAVQNAVQRLYMGTIPPTTMMTGNTTQIMIDVVDLLLGTEKGAGSSRARLANMTLNVVGFAAGCAAAALLFTLAGVWCFAVPCLIALAAVMVRADFPPP
jgi:uncharacterized membrane protein YoaK (UPF0700 family)